MSDRDLSALRVVIPGHVVFRDFPSETVVLNLQSGQYHGLNQTAGRMFEAMSRHDRLSEVVADVAAEFGQPAAVIETDLVALLDDLEERGLLQVVPVAAG